MFPYLQLSSIHLLICILASTHLIHIIKSVILTFSVKVYSGIVGFCRFFRTGMFTRSRKGHSNNETHLIPKIKLQLSDTTLPSTFQRQQFPLRPCFALTINKAQGQSYKVVGLDLEKPVFSHGMLYEALSRTGSMDSLHIFTRDGTTSNVVYKKFWINSYK